MAGFDRSTSWRGGVGISPHLQTRHKADNHFVNNDCQSALSRQVEVLLQWVPSHSNIDGNELADQAAVEAATIRLECYGQEQVFITYQADRVHIQREVRDRPPVTTAPVRWRLAARATQGPAEELRLW